MTGNNPDDHGAGDNDQVDPTEPFISRRLDGQYDLRLPEYAKELLTWLSSQLDEIVDGDGPELTRLFPTAYSDDPDMDAGYQIFARGELIDQRRESMAVLAATINEEVLGEDQLNAWMRVVNDLRLVIGTRLDVAEDDAPLPDKEEDVGLMEVYHWLGAMLSEIVDALTGGLATDAID